MEDASQPDPRVFKNLVEYYNNYIRDNLAHGKVWTWHALEVPFEIATIKAKDTQIHWAYYLKETIFSQAFEDTVTYREYVSWLSDLRLYKLSQEHPVVYTQIKKELEEQERIRKEKEAQAKLLEEEKNAKAKPGAKAPAAAAKPDPKKDAGKKPGAAVTDPKKASDQHLASDTNLAAPAVETKHEKTSTPTKAKPPRVVSLDWRPLEIINKQIKGLPLEALSSGVYLEAYIDEIETKFSGGLQSQLQQNGLHLGPSGHQLSGKFHGRMM